MFIDRVKETVFGQVGNLPEMSQKCQGQGECGGSKGTSGLKLQGSMYPVIRWQKDGLLLSVQKVCELGFGGRVEGKPLLLLGVPE